VYRATKQSYLLFAGVVGARTKKSIIVATLRRYRNQREKLKYYYSSLVVESSQEKSFLKDFEDFTTLREKSHCEEVPLGKIITETDLAAGEGLHSTLKRCKPNGMKFQTTR
jgi:hypothetical protein